MPHVHISGINAVIAFLFVFASFGSLHLLAASYPDARASQAFFALGF